MAKCKTGGKIVKPKSKTQQIIKKAKRSISSKRQKKDNRSSTSTGKRSYKKYFQQVSYKHIDAHSIEITSCTFTKHKIEGNFAYFSCIYQRRKKISLFREGPYLFKYIDI